MVFYEGKQQGACQTDSFASYDYIKYIIQIRWQNRPSLPQSYALKNKINMKLLWKTYFQRYSSLVFFFSCLSFLIY